MAPYLSETPVRSFKAPEPVLKAGLNYYAEIDTTKGKLLVQLFPDKAPNTVNSFVFLTLHHYFKDILWHRVIPGFMAQTGDPTGTGTGGPGYTFGLEINPSLNFDKAGILGMARTADPNSNGSQFFITLDPAPHLDGQYTVFGKVIEGMDTVRELSPTNGVPKSQWDKIISVRILTKPKEQG